jgi:thioredoxin reductase
LVHGQSALETAALLREEGATVTLVVRASKIAWNKVPIVRQRSLYQRLRRPRTQLGEGLKLWLYDDAPQLFHRLPGKLRISLVKEPLGPAGAWWLKERVMGQMPILLGHKLRTAEERNGRVVLHLTDEKGQPKELVADHVVASTGYKYKLQNVPFLDQSLKSQKFDTRRQQPRLSSYFESSVSGSYFCGLASTHSFGACHAVHCGNWLHRTSHRVAN